MEQIRVDQSEDEFCRQLRSWLASPATVPATKRGFLKSFQLVDGLLYWNTSAILICSKAMQLYFLEFFHKMNHAGFLKMRELMRQYVYWTGLDVDIRRFVASCVACQLTKPGNELPRGLLKSLEIPEERCRSISMEFAVMTKSRDGNDMLLLIVDRLTKFTVADATRSDLTARGCADLLYRFGI